MELQLKEKQMKQNNLQTKPFKQLLLGKNLKRKRKL